MMAAVAHVPTRSQISVEKVPSNVCYLLSVGFCVSFHVFLGEGPRKALSGTPQNQGPQSRPQIAVLCSAMRVVEIVGLILQKGPPIYRNSLTWHRESLEKIREPPRDPGTDVALTLKARSPNS